MFYFGHLMGLQLIKYNIINKLKFLRLKKLNKRLLFIKQLHFCKTGFLRFFCYVF